MRILLTCLAAILYLLGWSAGKVALMLGWLWAGIMVGFDDARHRARVS
jgi:hypothetical protein